MQLIFSLFFFLLVSDQPVFFLLLSHLPKLIPTHSVFLIALPDLHDLLSLSLRLLNLLPRFLLFHFQQGDSIGEQLGVISSLLFVHASFFESTGDFFFILLILIVVTFLTIVVLLLLPIVLFILFHLLLGLWHWLGLFRGLNFFLLLLVAVHRAIFYFYTIKNSILVYSISLKGGFKVPSISK